jgi:hypothetical protein
MNTSRLGSRNPEEPSQPLKDLNLILTCLQDPRALELNFATPADASMLLCHLGAPLDGVVLAKIWDALRQNQPLDVLGVSYVAPSSQAILEERETIAWQQGVPLVSRSVCVRRLAGDDRVSAIAEGATRRDTHLTSNLELTLSRASTGGVALSLCWEGAALATTTRERLWRWKKMQAVFDWLGEEAIPGDLLPHAGPRCEERGYDEYHFRKVRLYTTLFPAEFVERELAEERARGPYERAGLDSHTEPTPDAGWRSLREPPGGTADRCTRRVPTTLTLHNAPVQQIAEIAQALGMPLGVAHVEEVIRCATYRSPLIPEHFESDDGVVLDGVAFHRQTTFVVDSRVRSTDVFWIERAVPDPSALRVSISMSAVKPCSGTPVPFLKSVFSWHHTDGHRGEEGSGSST